jgi:hypothetical protein
MIGLGILALSACDRSGEDLLPTSDVVLPQVIEIGDIQVISKDDLANMSSGNAHEWCEGDDTSGRRCFYGQVSQPDLGVRGGATFTFDGTGTNVCLIVDPESVFWSQSIKVQGRNENFAYPDVQMDDGDIDLFAGLSSYYTGSPGVELGNFSGFYTDSLGTQVEIEYGECTQLGSSLSGITNAHSGRATVEFCDINTAEREGVQYTVVLETFSVPLDDGGLSFGAVAVEGRCSQINNPNGINECTIMMESLDAGSGNVRACSDTLEAAFCEAQLGNDPNMLPEDREVLLQNFCCAHPDMCGHNPPEDVCVNFSRTDFCAQYPGYCCGD